MKMLIDNKWNFQEYAKLAIDNGLSVKTSLYLDNEYQLALSKIKDKEEHYRLLTFSSD